MIYVGIDVAKDKHDCHILNSDGAVLCDNLSITNSREGFEKLKDTLLSFSNGEMSKIKVGLEATGHYSDNLLSFLSSLAIQIVEFNPLSVSRLKKPVL